MPSTPPTSFPADSPLPEFIPTTSREPTYSPTRTNSNDSALNETGRRVLAETSAHTTEAAWPNVWNLAPDLLRNVTLPTHTYAPGTTNIKAQECALHGIADGACDQTNSRMECGFDGGDCCAWSCRSTDENTCPGSSSTTPNSYAPTPAPTNTPTWTDCHSPELDANDDSAWPYYKTFASTNTKITHTSYPFSFYQGMFDILEQQYTDAMSDASMPSMSCPDCNLYTSEQQYMSIPFDVTVTPATKSRGTNPYENPMFPAMGTTPRRRYFSRPNIVLIGPLLTQTRIAETSCHKVSGTKRFGYLVDSFGEDHKKTCTNPDTDNTNYDRYDNSPYGVDPTFIPRSSLYRATNAGFKTTMYSDSEISSSTGVPFGFFKKQGGTGVDFEDTGYRFPIIIDVNVNVSRARDSLTYLIDGRYFDQQTRDIYLRLLLFNPEQSKFVFVSLLTTASIGGGYTFGYEVFTIDAEPYAEQVSKGTRVRNLSVFDITGRDVDEPPMISSAGTLAFVVRDFFPDKLYGSRRS